ncbi:MAG: PD-(D/E)XK nuclease family protein [Deltaproteobacteria bacterium]|nr:PD-(D/E)XK nuclease family protein [Deltaproteobacteria bacterium]
MADQLYLWPEDQQGDRLTWSWSKDRRLKDCLRRYYLHHYVSRGGASAGAQPLTREAYLLKNLRNRHMWVGEVVHEMIELGLGALRRGEQASPAALVERGTRRMRAQYAESLQGVYRERPLHACGLMEHEYREEVPKEEWKRQRDRMERCVRAFFELELVAKLEGSPPWRWLALENLTSFDLDGATVLVKPDLAWRDHDDTVVLVDWKTGKARPDDEERQLAVYGLFARRSWVGGGGGLRGVVAHLDDGGVSETNLDDMALARAEASIRSSLATMRALHPEAAGPELRLDRFPVTADAGFCVHCAFKRLCDR